MHRSAVAGSSPSRIVVIDSVQALDDFRRSLRNPILPPARVVLDPDFVEGSVELERQLNELYSECGCSAGSAATLLAAVAYGARLFAGGKPPSSRQGLHGLAAVGGAALAGKAAGVARSRLALLRLTASVRARQA